MRHVILGSNTPIGSSIVRLLTSINAGQVIAVSPRGILPDGVDPKKAEAKFGDVVDIYTLNELFEAGDVIYHCQIVSDEMADYEDAEIYNNIGFVNLLGIATSSEVARIVCAMPQTLGYKLPEVATEKDYGSQHSRIQASLRNMLATSEKYRNGAPFGWKQATIEKFSQQVEASNKARELEKEQEEQDKGDETPSNTDSSGPSSPPSGPSMPDSGSKTSTSTGPSLGSSGGPNLGGKAPTSGPSLGSRPSSSGPKLDPSSSSGPQLGGSPDSSDDNSSPSTGDDPNDETKINKEDSAVKEQEIPDSIDYDPVPLVIGRIAKLFGPFDPEFTEDVCRSIRLQRMSIVGPHDKQITWINPIDAGRAMIILGDQSVDAEPGQYLINGFVASPREIFDKLDEINHSDLDLEIKSLLGIKLRHIIKWVFSKLGLHLKDEYYRYLAHNRRQVFDDSKARETLGWEPKFDLVKTAKDAMNWFISHQL